MGYGTLIQRITYKISGRSAASSGLYTPSNVSYDYALGGIPFLSATSDTRPDIEKPVPQRKDQFDSFKDPGEYSLNQWWLRSQSSFIGGAGVVYQDPDTQGEAKNIRFAHSIGVDPFSDSDEIGLLRETQLTDAITADTQTTGFPWVSTWRDAGLGEMAWIAKGKTVQLSEVLGGVFNLNTTFTVPSSSITSRIVAGIVSIQNGPEESLAYAWNGDNLLANGGLFKFDSSTGVTTRIYVPVVAADEIDTIEVARGLIAIGHGNNLYMLDPYAAANTALPAANAAVPQDQTIVAITDGPDAVYVAANDSTQGYIYKTTFNASGIVNGLTLTAILPTGEQINDIKSYVSTYLIIATRTGVRVGTFTANGVSYGPSIMTTSDVEWFDTTNDIYGSGFDSISTFGSRAYVGTRGNAQHDGVRGIMAIDLGVTIGDTNTGAAFNPYCTWIYYPNSIASVIDTQVTPFGRVIFTTNYGIDAKVYLEHADKLIESGYLDTGRCRFNTIEPKLFKYFSIRTPTPLEGEVSVSLLDDTGGITNYITYSENLTPGTDDIATPTPGGPRNYESLRFTLRRSGTDTSVGGRLDSWQIKALPGTLKQRMITRQFLCFNSEQDKTGQRISGDAQSLDKLTAVRQMCQRGDTVTLQDLVQNISTQVIIDDYQFTMLAPPGPNKENYGGYLTVVMRTVADAVPIVTPVMVEGD